MKRKVLQTVRARAAIALGLAASAAAVLLLAGTPAFAALPQPISGALLNIGDEPQAAGGFSASLVLVATPKFECFYQLNLIVGCTNLTPGATYVLDATPWIGHIRTSFVANDHGAFCFTRYFRTYPGPYGPLVIIVSRVDGSTLIPVLAYPRPSP
jgi:hypothetical protein